MTNLKGIKFADKYVVDVLNRQKNATVRYSGFNDVAVGDVLIATTAMGVPFCRICIEKTAVVEAWESYGVLNKIGARYDSDTCQNHLERLNSHYDDEIERDTLVKVLSFSVLKPDPFP